MLEVDLSYPEDLHDLHNDFPLAPVKTKVDYTKLSDYQKDLIAKFTAEGQKIRRSEKLILDFNEKKSYVIHYMNLQYYLEKGIKLTKVHRIIKFHQSAWLEQYVNLCTAKRMQATTAFEKEFWKLMINSFMAKRSRIKDDILKPR